MQHAEIVRIHNQWPTLSELTVKIVSLQDLSSIAHHLPYLRKLHIDTAYVMNGTHQLSLCLA